ncbi:MAG: sensor histidine kinase [Actinomycetota bacterium]|nr:sensor histidine kinase [Actinomycetota bacterium]
MPQSDAIKSPFPAQQPRAFRHDAVFYRGARDFVPAVLPFVAAAVERHEPVLVAVLPAREEALRSELGDATARVEFVDMQSAGRNPARIIPVWSDFVRRHADSGKVLNGVGEPIWGERTPQEIAECQRHESLLNLAFAAAGPFALICPYDEAGLPADVVAAARESHPHIIERGERQVSSCYHGVAGIEGSDGRPLPAAPEHLHARRFRAADIAAVRREVEAWAIAHGVEASRAADLSLAVHEAAANSIRHGGGRGVLRSWTADDAAVCEIADAGALRDPLVGRSLPPPHSGGGRGIWLINHLCDLVQVRTTAAGTVVRMHQHLGPAA